MARNRFLAGTAKYIRNYFCPCRARKEFRGDRARMLTENSTPCGRKSNVERLWQEFFSNPSQWWDNRPEKVNPRYPDFKHQKTQQGLWLIDRANPAWVETELAAMAPGTLKVHIFTWNKRLERYVKDRQYEKALQVFKQMQQEGINPDVFTFVPVLNACSNMRALGEGRHIHAQIIEGGGESDVFVGNSLVDMYSKCGSIQDAWKVFTKMPARNVVTWSAMIMGCVKCGQGRRALELFHQMAAERVDPDAVTFVGVLNACASVVALEEGRNVHKQIVERGWESDVFVANSLIDMYSKCGTIEDAQIVFNAMPTRDVVAWSTMILGYTKSGKGQVALELFQQMQQDGPPPNTVTYVAVLNACASVEALEEGSTVHKDILRRGCESNVFVVSSLIHMYAKCGSIYDAKSVFTKVPTHNGVTWNAMLAGYAMHGLTKEAVEHFKCMCQEGVELDDLTFLSLLSACGHGGLVDEGLYYFECMNAVHNISPSAEHHACVVDLLGRAGYLHEAEDFIRRMPCEANINVWRALLGACRIHGNVEVGERAAKQVLGLDSTNASGYVLLTNIYSAGGR